MRSKILIAIILTFFIVICNNINTYALPSSDVYKQGIYKLTDDATYNADVKLIKGPQTTLILMEKNQNVVLYIKLYLNEELKLTELGKDYTITIIGDGEVAITYNKIN